MIFVDNITALYETVSQSSDFGIHRAVDAVDRIYDGASYTHTPPHVPGWWRLTFKHTVRIYSVHLYNRVDCCYGRLNDVDINVFVEAQRITAPIFCANTGAIGSNLHKEFICQQVTAGIVLEISAPEVLSLQEVDVIGNH